MTGSRWQYAVANIGMFGAADRLARCLAHLGSQGFELVTVYDKASNWFNGYEKGFMLFKREVPDGSEPDGPWCALLDPATLKLTEAVLAPDVPDQAW
ncbi:MAG: hypothetical protein AB7R77_06020 [Ilumatobacteraceae bacterium]